MADPEIALSAAQIRAIGKSLRGEFLKGFIWWFGILSLIFGFGLLQVYRNAADRLEGIMVKRISDEFNEPRIRATVSLVASNYAGNAISTQIEPEVTRFKDEVRLSASNTQALVDATQKHLADIDARVKSSAETEKQLKSTLDEATRVLAQLKELAEFVLISSSAVHDDREAYEQLKLWSVDPNYALRARAGAAYLQIRTEYWGMRGNKNWAVLPNASELFPETLTLEQVLINWKSISPFFARDYVQRVWTHPGLPKEDKLSFLYSAIHDSRNSLHAADAAARLLASEGDIHYNPAFEFGVIEDWWIKRNITNTVGQSGKGE